MSAFLSYSQEMRPKIRDIHPELKNTEISSILAQQWRAASEEDKRPHIEKELRQREKYYEDMAKWKADEEVRKKSSSDSSLPYGPGCKTQLDFLDIGTASRENSAAFWSSIENKHGSYEPNENEASSIDRMNQYLSDGGADESATDFWDQAFDEALDQRGFDELESSPLLLSGFPESSNPPDAVPRDQTVKTGVSSSSKEHKNQKSPSQRRSKRKAKDNLACSSSDSTSHHSSKRKRSSADAPDGEDKDKAARSVRKEAQSSTSADTSNDHMGPPAPPAAFYFPLPASSSNGSSAASSSNNNDTLAQSMLPSYALGYYLAKLQQQLLMEQQMHHHQQQQQQARHDEEIFAQQQQIDQQQRLLHDLYNQNQHLLRRGGPQNPQFPFPIIPNILMSRPIPSSSVPNDSVNPANVSSSVDDSAAVAAAAGGQRNDKSVWQRRLPHMSASPADNTTSSAMSVSDKTSSESVSTISGRSSHSGSSKSGKRKDERDESGQKEDFFSYTMDRFRESPIDQRDQTVLRMNVSDRPYQDAEDAAALNDGASDREDLTSESSSKRDRSVTADVDLKDDGTGKRRNPPTEIIAKASSSGHKKGSASQNNDTASVSFSSSQQSQKPFPPPPLYQQIQHPYLFPQLHLVPPQFQFLQPSAAGMSMAPAVPTTGNGVHPELSGPNAAVAAAMMAAATAALSQGLVPIPYPVSAANFAPSASSIPSKSDNGQQPSREVPPARSRLTHAVLNSLPPPLTVPPSEPVFRVESSLPSSASNTEAVTPATTSSSSASSSSGSLTAPGTSGMSKLTMAPSVYEGPPPPVVVDDTNKVNHEVLVNAPTLLKLALRVGYDEDVFTVSDAAPPNDHAETKTL